jgi:superfamily I DNA/RNA helicase
VLVDEAEADLIRLTEEQRRAYELFQDNRRVVVRGGAGTGKTLLAISEAKKRAESGEKVFLCCFNARLAAHLDRVMADHPLVDVRHLHGFMRRVVVEAGLSDQVPAAEEEDLFGLFFPLLCLEGMDRLGLKESYDVLIVDEGQDLLRDAYMDVLDALLKGGLGRGCWRLFLDHNQNIFQGIDSMQLGRLDEYDLARARLPINCRNTEPIAIQTQLLSGVYCDETPSAEGPAVQEYWYRDQAHERREVSNCVQRLLSEGLEPNQIVILSPYRLVNSGIRDGLINVPYALDQLGDVSPRTDSITFSTIGAFKGLESDVVLLIDINSLGTGQSSQAVYVGASRAKSLLAVFYHEAVRQMYAKRARAFGEQLAGLSS